MTAGGPVALVTGGAGGIGWAIAQRLAESGMTVVIADIDGDRAQRRAGELGNRHGSFAVDISDPAKAAAMVHECHRKFGRIDVLINNVGRTNNSGLDLSAQSRESFDEIIAINTVGALAASTEAAELMAKDGGGSIVNVASGAAFRALPFRSAYSTSKAALVAMSRHLALTWAQKDVRVNVVAPGFVHTELLQDLISSGRLDPSQAIAKIPLGRMGKPQEIAAAVEFFASSSSSAITGAALNADGGSSSFGGSGAAARQIGSPPTNPPDGTGVVVVVGAANRLGAAFAEGHGLRSQKVILIDTDTEGLTRVQEGASQGCTTLKDDGDSKTLSRLLREIKEAEGRIDSVINLRPEAFGGDAGPATIRERLGRAHRVIRAVGPIFLEQGYGSLLNFAYSPNAQNGSRHAEVTAAVEGGIEMLSRTVACEWGGSGVRTNTITVETVSDIRDGMQGSAQIARLRRIAGTADIVRCAAFLLSPDAGFVNAAKLSLLASDDALPRQ